MGGGVVQTWWQGLLSGLGHPVIGVDHLAFLIAAGIAAAFVAGGRAIPLLFAGASLAGTGVHLAKVGVPFVEAIVALTVITGGIALALGRATQRSIWLILVPVAGLFHGYALAESIIGAEPTPLAAYLVGLSLVEVAVIAAVMVLARLELPLRSRETRARAAGALVAVLGLYFLATTVIAA